MVDMVTDELVKPEGMPPLQWEWWKEWWAHDYSWNSERFRPYREVISNSYNASGSLAPLESTLKSQGHLIESPEGILFHICWLPPYWRNGTPTEFYEHPVSVRNKATNAFVTYFKEHRGTYAGLTSTLGLMLTSVSHSIPLNRVEKGFLGGPFIRTNVGGSSVVHLHQCLFAFGNEDGESRQVVDWNVNLYRSTFSNPGSSAPMLNFNYINFVWAFNLSDCNIDAGARFLKCNFFSNFFLGESNRKDFKRKFDGDILFFECVFTGEVNASQIKEFKKINFNNCTFQSKFSVSVMQGHCGISSILSFSGSAFESKVSIRSDNLIEVAPAFADTTLKKGIDFGPFEAVLDEKFFKRLRADILKEMASWPDSNPSEGGNRRDLRVYEDAELHRMISGIRVVRLASQSRGDKLSEAHLHALELAAYQRLSNTPTISKFFASAFGLFSDYGCSLAKPLLWLLALLIISSLGYSLLNESAQQAPLSEQLNWPEVLQGLVYSISRVIPVGPWQDLVFADSILSTGKGASPEPSSPQKVAVVLLATVQSIFSAILLFLFGLAARRKFQVG